MKVTQLGTVGVWTKTKEGITKREFEQIIKDIEGENEMRKKTMNKNK